jgi:hypothetical protein
MTDLGKGRSGPKETDNRDKSLHGLMVALAMAGAIAGSAILFAYASSTESATATSDVPPEPVIVEKIIEKPVYIERIKYVNQTVEVEKPVYINRTVEVEKEVPVYVEVEKQVPVYIYVNETDDDSDKSTASDDAEEQEEEKDNDDKEEESELRDLIPEQVLGLLDYVADDEKDDEEDDDDDRGENKGKGKDRHDDEDDD